ncbi:hypothetical protein QQF64_009954 [Cirrhinus molitorella]|uniref:Uncharacterized protein n=1 Tax=Cirrhinus molitorella TaxID=172907 RepID=A0ABR3M680_9TELE
MQTAHMFAVLFQCLSFIEGKWLEGETCVGIRKEDSSYDFDLPDRVAVNLQDPECDAECTIDQSYTAILDGNSSNFTHPFKNLTRYGMSAFYCPASVKFHISCPKYTNEFSCSCTNSTDSNSVPCTILPSRDCTIAAAVTFVLVLWINWGSC